MIPWIIKNISTLIVCAVIAFLVCLVIAKMIRDKKNGNSGCSCNCSGCPNAKKCGRSK